MPRAQVPGPGDRTAQSATRLVVAVIGLGTALRLVLAATIGLGVDESYAMALTRAPSLSYLDHPPLAFWIAAGTVRLTGHETGVIVRLPFVLLFAATTWLMYRLSARLFGARAGAYAALVLNLAPVFSLSTGGWVLPDGPLAFFLVLTTICLVRVLLQSARPPLLWWTAAGGAAGFATLSKYHALLLLPGLTLFLLTQRDARRWLRTPGPYVGAIVAAALFTPVLVWNARHGWASIRFQLARGAPGAGIHPVALLQNIAGQAGYLLPWIWLPLVALLLQGLARGPADAARWLLVCLAVWPIGVFTLIALGGRPGLPHWPAPGYLLLLPLLGNALASRIARAEASARRWLVGSTAAFAILVTIAATQTATGWITHVAPTLFRHGDPTLEALDWTDLRTTLAARRLLRGQGLFVGATSWIEAAKIAYALGPAVPVLCLCEHPHHFQYLDDQRAFLGHDALLLDRTRGTSDARRRYTPYFTAIDSLEPVVIRRAGSPAMTIAVFRGRDFRMPYPSDLPP